MSTNTNITVQNQTTPIPEGTFYGTSAPTSTAAYSAGDIFYVTPLGTQSDSANATEIWRFDGTKWVKTPSGESVLTGQNVYIDTTTPATATIFDIENPPVTNDDALKQDSANTYYGTDGSVWIWNGTAYITKVYNFTLHQRTVITATANQTSFTLPKVPIGGTEMVYVTRNGVDISNSFSWVAKVGTYTPANNGSKTIDASDIIRFHYEAY